jgi:hypothetical protein
MSRILPHKLVQMDKPHQVIRFRQGCLLPSGQDIYDTDGRLERSSSMAHFPILAISHLLRPPIAIVRSTDIGYVPE